MESKIEEYRQPWESDEHWDLRREFLLAHWGKFSETRLLCLAQCYTNMELMGCSYPAEVMRQVRALAEGMQKSKHLRELRTERNTINFVKSQEEKEKRKNEKLQQSVNKYSRTAYNQAFARGSPDSPISPNNNTPQSQGQRMSAASFFQPSQGNHDGPGGGRKGFRSRWGNEEPMPPNQYGGRSRPSFRQYSNQGELPTPSPQVSNIRPTSQPKANTIPSGNNNSNSMNWGQRGERGWKVQDTSNAMIMERCVPQPPSKPWQQTVPQFDNRHAQQTTGFIGRHPRPNAPAGPTGMSHPSPLEKKFMNLGRYVKTEEAAQPNVLQLIQVTATKLYMKILFTFDVLPGRDKRNPTFLSCLLLEGILVGKACGPSKKIARINAYTNAVSKLKMPHMRIIYNSEGKLELLTSNKPLNNVQGATPIIPPHPNDVPEGKIDNALKQEMSTDWGKVQKYCRLEDFIILDELEINKTGNAVSILRLSADFNHVELLYDFNSFTRGNCVLLRCEVTLGGNRLGEGFGDCKQSAKLDAATRALEVLKIYSYTIRIKARFIDGGHRISKNEVSESKPDEASDAITQDNVGFKLLKMMGWQGGGVGKDSSGIAEPVSLKDVYNREGLGYSETRGVTKEFLNKIQEIVKQYAQSDATHDLVFSSEFSKDERKEIHSIASRYQLKSVSRGRQGAGRHIVLSRRFSPRQLLRHLIESGGHTDKYELLPPRQGASGFQQFPRSSFQC